ncbi:MAG: holo-ACP synthase [Deltaproteobacteria bacterium]|nr:holo-ACP synthase [Deltaproteobacteria bacterium]
MIIGIGLDIVPIVRVAAMLARHGVRAEQRLFSAAERADCAGRGEPAQHYAARFAAKEAVLKALGGPPGLKWTEIEVRTADSGRPVLLLSGAAAGAAAQRGVVAQHVSLTHAGGMAAAVVVLEGRV